MHVFLKEGENSITKNIVKLIQTLLDPEFLHPPMASHCQYLAKHRKDLKSTDD